ncbi:hypothetical protein GCM10010305_12810 [Streptomyces termitum]|uniref:Uncharacterized protein n=1 Tax=Streptomyces termitum TaxID=67368 RepID=A0A918W6T5_9ACTN|nr:hypothetical protein GCM10010305_12810 [Streptomyces termitum]
MRSVPLPWIVGRVYESATLAGDGVLLVSRVLATGRRARAPVAQGAGAEAPVRGKEISTRRFFFRPSSVLLSAIG